MLSDVLMKSAYGRRAFSKRYFMVTYDYVEDSYYKRSKVYFDEYLVPHREIHLK